MKLAIFDEQRLGVVLDDRLVDVTAALPWDHDADPLTAGWWRRLCRDYPDARDRLSDAAAGGTAIPLSSVALKAPVMGPSKVVAAACNYPEHVEEMHTVQERTLGGVESWMMNFDVFLKSPSSVVGPADDIVLPAEEVDAGHEIHHESELVAIIGTGGKDIAEERALEHVFGYTIGLDITVRSAADRSRRKSYDSFSPLGPWVTTADEAGDPADLDIELECDGEPRQKVHTSTMITPVPRIVSYASHMMTLLPGDVLFTGAPQGVGPITAGNVLVTRISRLGEMQIRVR